MMELVAGILVAAAVLALVLEPIVRGRPWVVATRSLDEEIDFTDIEESESPKVRALLAIKEIEFDRETGKLSDEDYQSLKATYQRVALAAIKVDDKKADEQSRGDASAVCPNCGPRPESAAAFCSECGRTLAGESSSLRCSGCGAVVAAGAKFCGECGAAVAANR